jgi:pimeloyl-ACP methyl ester carboxylesterase
MWATDPLLDDEGIAGATFDSDGHRLVGTLYLARGDEPKPTALLLHGCPGLEKNLDLAALLRDRGWNSLLFHYRGCWGSAGRYDLRTIPRDVTEVDGANHSFAWHRAELRDLIAGWLSETGGAEA